MILCIVWSQSLLIGDIVVVLMPVFSVVMMKGNYRVQSSRKVQRMVTLVGDMITADFAGCCLDS